MTEQINQAVSREYEAGFVSDIESETFDPDLMKVSSVVFQR